MFTVLFTSAMLCPHYTHVICISIFCPYPNVSYDTLTTREGAAQQDSSGAAAAQDVGTVWKLAGDKPHLWSVPRNPQFRPFGLYFQGLGKRGSNRHIWEKKKERTIELTPSENLKSNLIRKQLEEEKRRQGVKLQMPSEKRGKKTWGVSGDGRV